ncbi:MAG: GNAT family N-acetyltransferase [Candidatus Bathyarchaeia archaeon]|jgi:ribosomal protein S18 acetylase RimI-like enzyme
MTLQIETASVALLDALYEVEKQCFKAEAFSKQQIRYLLLDYNAFSLVAKVDGQVAGFVIGRLDWVQNQPVGHIMTLDVLPCYRRAGVAERLMVKLEELFRLGGALECRLEVRVDNVAALNLYFKLGYRMIGVLENYYESAHGFYLKKNLKRVDSENSTEK